MEVTAVCFALLATIWFCFIAYQIGKIDGRSSRNDEVKEQRDRRFRAEMERDTREKRIHAAIEILMNGVKES